MHKIDSAIAKETASSTSSATRHHINHLRPNSTACSASSSDTTATCYPLQHHMTPRQHNSRQTSMGRETRRIQVSHMTIPQTTS